MGVLQRKTFSHTPDEARSVGLAKACVPSKNLFCYREISFNTMLLIQCVWCGYESVWICTFMNIYTSVLCIDSITVLRCPCVLLANHLMLSFWMNVYAYLLYVYYMCIQILIHYGCMYTSMFDVFSYIHFCLLSSHYYPWTVNVYMWMFILASCIATVGKDRYGLGDERFERCADVYVSVALQGPLLS